MDVRVGLDFGTHQTKVCMNFKKQGQRPEFEFINFGTNDKINFFLPSKVNVHQDKTISIGNSTEPCKSYQYFKIASAEDKQFRGISGIKGKTHYDLSRYDHLSPEVLSVIYLAHTLGTLKSNFEKNHAIKKLDIDSSSYIGQFLGGSEKLQPKNSSSFNYFYQIGIPTEWSSRDNTWRRRKFEQILYLANTLISTLGLSLLKELKINKVLEVVEFNNEILRREMKYNAWNEFRENLNLSAFPETAAGLTYLVKTGKIPEGYYLAVDIGGGSSDISFFRVNSNKTFEYLASESLLIACNDIYDYYTRYNPDITSTENAQKYLEDLPKNQIDIDGLYKKAFKQTIQRLNTKIKKVYNQRVYWHFQRTVANKRFSEQSCFLYGGGSLIHTPSSGIGKMMEEILLHNQGTESITASETYAIIDRITEIDPPHKIEPNSWKQHLPLLIVPLGLSFMQPDEVYDWDYTEYKAGEGEYHLDEYPEFFDIFKRQWV